MSVMTASMNLVMYYVELLFFPNLELLLAKSMGLSHVATHMATLNPHTKTL